MPQSLLAAAQTKEISCATHTTTTHDSKTPAHAAASQLAFQGFRCLGPIDWFMYMWIVVYREVRNHYDTLSKRSRPSHFTLYSCSLGRCVFRLWTIATAHPAAKPFFGADSACAGRLPMGPTLDRRRIGS